MPFQDKSNGTRAKAHQTISGRPAAAQANGTRAKAHQVISGHAPQQQPNGARAKAAAVNKNPLLDGSHVRDITRMYVAVDGENLVTVTFLKSLIVSKGNAERRVDTVVTATVKNERGKAAKI
jgi:hypothetical protein